MKKRFLVGAMTLAMVLSLVGCGKKDPQELINEANANLEKHASVTMDVVGDAGLKITSEGTTMSMGLDFDMNVKSNTSKDNLGMALDGTVGINAFGMEQDTPVKAYMIKEGDVYRTYTCEEDVWTYSDEEIAELDAETMEKIEKATEGKGTYTLREKREDVNEKDCYVVDYVLTAAEMIEVIEALDEEGSLKEAPEAAELINKVKDSEAKVTVTTYISKKDVMPVRYTINMNDFIKTMVDIAMDFASNMDPEATGGLVDTSALESMSIGEITFNLTVDVLEVSDDAVTVPADVKDNATTEEVYDWEY